MKARGGRWFPVSESKTRMWAESQQGPSGCAPCGRGYCAYCQVHYSDLDQHLSSVRHLDCVDGSSRVCASADSGRGNETLLERFLRDVLLHHPHRYKDSSPSDADLPSVSTPLLPRKRLDEVHFPDDDSCSLGARESLPGSDHLTGPRSQSVRSRCRRGAGQKRHTHQQQAVPPVHRKAHRKTDRRKRTRSVKGLDAGIVSSRWQSWQKQHFAASEEHSHLLDHTPEKEDTGSFHVSNSDWDSLVQVQPRAQQLPTQARDFSHLTDAQVDLRDQVYSHQLHAALRSEPRAAQVFCSTLQHFPQSFWGKTWSQIEEEDEKKVEDLVRQFRRGRFVCYFDGPLSRSGRGQEPAGSDTGFLPLVSPDEREVRKRQDFGRRRGFRTASRCQVVKVSHSTQTVHLVVPTVCPSTTEATPAAHPLVGAERTPEVQWNRLPPSYSPIVTPLQASTSLVYLLCSPTFPACAPPTGPTPKRSRRRQRPLDFQSLKVKYKPFPVAVYDPCSNRIVKNPPKDLKSSSPCAPLPPCARQLFRSLSPDLNAERLLRQEGSGSSRSKIPRLSDATSSLSDHVVVGMLSAGTAQTQKLPRRRRALAPTSRGKRERPPGKRIPVRTTSSSPRTGDLRPKQSAPQASARPRQGRPQAGCGKAVK